MKEAGNNDVYPQFDALRQRSRTPRAQTPVLETHVVVGCLFHDDNDPTEHDNTRAVDHRSAQWFPMLLMWILCSYQHGPIVSETDLGRSPGRRTVDRGDPHVHVDYREATRTLARCS